MMKEFSLHIMEIAREGITAGATEIRIEIDEEPANDVLTIIIEDNGKSLCEGAGAVPAAVTVWKRGVGIPFLEQLCLECGGHLTVESEPAKTGVRLTAVMQYFHEERPAMGDILSVIQQLIITGTNVNVVYLHRYNGSEYSLSTAEIKTILEGVPFETPSVSQWIKENMGAGLARIMRPI